VAAWPRGGPSAAARRALSGASAAVVGLLLAALLGTVRPAAIMAPVDALLVALGPCSLVVLRVPPLVVVAAAAVGGLLGA